MTDEAHGYNSEDAPVRPASTRWSDDTDPETVVQDDEDLAPPYVPGRRTPAAASTSTSSSTTSTSTSTTTPDDDFPFDQFDIDGDADAAAPDSSVGEEAAATSGSGVTEDPGSEADEMVWSPDELDGGEVEQGHERFDQAEREYGEEFSGEEPSDEPTYAEDRYGEWTPPYEDEDDGSAVDAELEPLSEEAPVEQVEAADVEPEHRFEPDGSIESGPDERVEEVAAVLDRLAGLLREEGEDAVRREMESQDRLTALVSSLLIGHLSARQ